MNIKNSAAHNAEQTEEQWPAMQRLQEKYGEIQPPVQLRARVLSAAKPKYSAAVRRLVLSGAAICAVLLVCLAVFYTKMPVFQVAGAGGILSPANAAKTVTAQSVTYVSPQAAAFAREVPESLSSAPTQTAQAALPLHMRFAEDTLLTLADGFFLYTDAQNELPVACGSAYSARGGETIDLYWVLDANKPTQTLLLQTENGEQRVTAQQTQGTWQITCIDAN